MIVKISYKPLWKTLIDKEMKKKEFKEAIGGSSDLMTRLNKGEHITTKTILKICEVLKCKISDVVEVKE